MMCLGGDLFEFISFGVCSKMGIFQPLFLGILFQPTFLLSFLDSTDINDIVFPFHMSVRLCLLCFSVYLLFLRLRDLFYFCFEVQWLFPAFSLLLLSPAIEFLFMLLYTVVLNFQFGSLYIFYCFAETIFFFAESLFFICFKNVYSSSMKHVYDNYFKTLVR